MPAQNTSQTSPQTIGVDCRLSGDEHAGIGRYIEELILRLPLLAPDRNWVFFFYSQKQADQYLKKLNLKKEQQSNIKIVIAPIRHYSLEEQTKLPQIFKNQNLDLLHVPHFNVPLFYQGKFILTIHDLLWHEFKGFRVTTLSPIKYLFKYFAYRFITRQAINKAHKIMVPAKSIKNAISNYYPQAKNKITVTYEGASLKFENSPQSTPSKKQFNPKQLIYVGSLYPHKNIKLVLEALSKLPEYTLKIVGSRNVFQDQIKNLVQKLNLESKVIFTGFLSDKELNSELNKSLALVQPSLSEGFGLTGIEAMAAGTPVLASDIPIFKEIYQSGALFFDPYDALSFVETLKKLEKKDRSKLIQQGKKVSQTYNWDKMTKETFEIYEQI